MLTVALFVRAPNNQMSYSRWWVKQMVVYPYQGILPSNKKEWIIDTCNSLDGFQMHYAEWKNISLKSPHTVEFQLYKILEMTKLWDRDNKLVVARVQGWWERVWLWRGSTRDLFMDDGLVINMVMAPWMYMWSNIHMGIYTCDNVTILIWVTIYS